MHVAVFSHELPESLVEQAESEGKNPMDAFESQLQSLSEQLEGVNDGAHGEAIAHAVNHVHDRSRQEFTDSAEEHGRRDLRTHTK